MSKSRPKADRITEIFEFEREVRKANAEFNKLPPWRQAELEGDYLSTDSGMSPGDTLDN